MLLNVDLKEAQQLLLQKFLPLPPERISLLQAGGRVLAEDVVVNTNLPLNAVAARDGYVVHRDDIRGQLVLSLISPSTVGLPQPLKKGETCEVATGAVVPDNAAALVPHEEADVREDKIYLNQAVPNGNCIRPAGEDFKSGELLARSGDAITPGLVSALAAQGKREVLVYQQPRVAVLSLGPRLVSCEQKTAPGKHSDSNGPLLASLAFRDGAIVTGVEILGDKEPGFLPTLMQEMLAEADLLLTIGGTYGRKQSEARLSYQQLGAEIIFWGVPIQPGGHNGAALWNSKMLFSLSGNPAACAVGYELLAAPVIRALQRKVSLSPEVKAECMDAIKGKGERCFIRARLFAENNSWKVKVLPGQKPGMINSLIKCNALIDLPSGADIEAGTLVSVIILDTSSIWF